MTAPDCAARVQDLSHSYGKNSALSHIELEIPGGCMAGLIGPDGVGKSTLLSLIAGARRIRAGRVEVLGGDMAEAVHRDAVCPRIAYMPQGLGRNLYPTLSVEENLQFIARLFGQDTQERRRRIDELTHSTGLHPFLARPAGQLSGGMKQKLGLCCALIHDPDLLILDEPTTGVDPLARAQFWELIARLRQRHPGMSVIVATAYMDEAQAFDWLAVMDQGLVLATGTPAALLARTGASSLESAFIGLLPAHRKEGHQALSIPPLETPADDIAIEADNLSMRFADGFTAVDHVSFRIRRGEIFGFLGSNGCGKTTTMKMLTGLLPASSGRARLFGQQIDPHDVSLRKRVGYMSQSFSLYKDLSVRQNLALHARLFHLPAAQIGPRVEEMARRFELMPVMDSLAADLPMGIRQRLSLAVATIHGPEILILDEPTSGVDPVARDHFWHLLVTLSRRDKVTIFLSTHFMNEAQRCDRMSMMHAGKVLDSDTPTGLMHKRGAASLEQAFIGYLVQPGQDETHGPVGSNAFGAAPVDLPQAPAPPTSFSWQRMLSYAWREALELRRDPVRATMALLGSLLLMFVIGYGISTDVNGLPYAVLDQDQSSTSRDYVAALRASPYFQERAPIKSTAQLDRRMQSGELTLAIEIPSGFGRRLAAGRQVEIGAWINGALPSRAETVQAYVQGMHLHWLEQRQQRLRGRPQMPGLEIQTRLRYNSDLRSLPAILPAVIPLLLLTLPAMLTALAVVREKELGAIINFYVTPVTRLEFLCGKQLPYIALGMLNFLLMSIAAVTLLELPVKGSYTALVLATLMYLMTATGMGLVASALTRSQIAAMFAALLGTLVPATQFAGMTTPVSSLEGMGRLVGEIHPASHMFLISRGVYAKALGLTDLATSLTLLLATLPVVMGLALVMLRKQEG